MPAILKAKFEKLENFVVSTIQSSALYPASGTARRAE